MDLRFQRPDAEWGQTHSSLSGELTYHDVGTLRPLAENLESFSNPDSIGGCKDLLHSNA